MKAYWTGQDAPPTAEWLKWLPWSPLIVLLVVWASKVKRSDGAEHFPPLTSYHLSHLRTMAASKIQECFPKLHCAAESPGAIFKFFWLWNPGICFPNNQGSTGPCQSLATTALVQDCISGLSFLKHLLTFAISKISRWCRYDIDPWSSNTFFLKFFFSSPLMLSSKVSIFLKPS